MVDPQYPKNAERERKKGGGGVGKKEKRGIH